MSKHLLKKTVVTLLISLVALAKTFGQENQPAKPQQQPEDVVRIYTDLVQTDVMVFDKQGRFVNGLKREDFDLRVDGKPQPIEFFERVAAGSADEEAQLSAARGSGASNPKNAGPVPLDRGRTIFFYVDDFHLSAGDLVFLRKALLHFIDSDLGQNDEAVITSASGQIGFLQQLTDNKAVLRAAVERLKARPQNMARDSERPPMNEYQALVIDRSPVAMGPSGNNYHDLTNWFIDRKCEELQDCSIRGREVADMLVHNRARTILEQAAAITTNTLAVFESLVRSSTQLPGRKLVFFISNGFYLDRRNSDTVQRLDQITTAAARNGVVVYAMDARALTTGQPLPGDEVTIDMSGIIDREQKNELLASREGMEVLANNTGGRTIFDTNALDVGLAKALKETSVYYLLAWRRNHEDENARKPRHVEVSLLGRPDSIVRLRQGIFNTDSTKNARPTTKKEQKNAEKPSEVKLGEALAAIYPNNELPVALSLDYLRTPDKGLLLTASLQLMSDSLSFTTVDGKDKAMVDLAGSVYNDQGKVVAHFSQQRTITTTLANQARPANRALVFNYQTSLSPGLYQIRAGARDEKSGKVGTVHEWIEMPDLSAHHLTLSNLIVGELPPLATSSVPADQNLPSRMLLRVDHRFHRNSALRFLFYIYNATLAAGGSKPDLVMQVQVLRDRQPVITTPLEEVATTSLQAPDQLPSGADLPLERLMPGRYLLLVTVIDRVAKTSASQEMRFEVR